MFMHKVLVNRSGLMKAPRIGRREGSGEKNGPRRLETDREEKSNRPTDYVLMSVIKLRGKEKQLGDLCCCHYFFTFMN